MRIKHNGNTIEWRLTFKTAMYDLRELGINVLNLLETENLNNLVQKVMYDDEAMLTLYFRMVDPEGDFEKFTDTVDRDDLQNFRRELWDEIVNFTNPLFREILRKAWDEVPKMIQAEIQKVFSSSSGTT